MKFLFSTFAKVSSGTIIIGVLEGCKLGQNGKALDKELGNTISRELKANSFKGKANQSILITGPSKSAIDRVVVIGLGSVKNIDYKIAENLGGKIYAQCNSIGAFSLTVTLDTFEGCPLKTEVLAAHIAFGAQLGSYKFEKYKTIDKPSSKVMLKSIKLETNNPAKAKAVFSDLGKVAEGVFLTRNLVSEPPNILYPDSLAIRCKELTKIGIKVEILNEAQMKKKGMGALLGVGQGSIRESRMVVMQWNGTPKVGKGKLDQPIAFVGKGVTFDTGGISLKPSGGMEDMKWDMGGAGVVIGLMKALAGRRANVNVVGVVGLVENMPGGNAQRPGDIVQSMSGQTIEVLNTDAEGRLVLADALYYTNNRFNPKFMINLATLTGAIIISLGNEHAGLFSNNDSLSERLSECGYEVDEKVWRMPLNKVYDKMIDCEIADMKNISGGRGAGSITAAQFLQRFVGKTPWAHLDIAGVTWSSKAKPTVPKGGTAFGVRLLERLVSKYYERQV